MSNIQNNKLLILIVGPSGSGKTTLERNLEESYSKYYSRIISCTTRKARAGEVDEVDYFFLTEEEFERREKNNEFLESVTFKGNNYGTLTSEVEKINKTKDALLVVEPKGMVQILDRIKNENLPLTPFIIFFDIKEEVLRENMRRRGDSNEMIESRLNDSIREDFFKSGVVPDILVSKLHPYLHKDIHNHIGLWKKIMF